MQAEEALSAPARPNQVATMAALEDAMAKATASHAPVERKLHTTREEYKAARADLDARARAGKTVQGRNRLGQFTRGVKVIGLPTAAAKKVKQPQFAGRIAGEHGVTSFSAEYAKRRLGLTPPVQAEDVSEPTALEINCVLVTCLVTGLSQHAKSEFYGRLQKMYDRAHDNPKRRSLVVAAAECIAAPLTTEVN